MNPITTKTTFAIAADLVSAVVMRGCGHGITGTRDGTFLTKQVVASSALNAFRTQLSKNKAG